MLRNPFVMSCQACGFPPGRKKPMARAIGVPPRAINEIVLGKRSITPAMSIRFGAFFSQSEDFWHGIQVECDFRALAKEKEKKKLVAGVKPASSIIPAT